MLAGGNSRRLQMNKPFISVGKSTLIEAIVEVLKDIFEPVMVVTSEKNHARLTSLFGKQALIVKDAVSDRGPIGGLFTGLSSVEPNSAFVTACDMPMLNRELIKYMQGELKHYDAVIPEPSDNHFELLHAIYASGCLTVFERHIETDRLSLHSTLPELNVRYLRSDEIKRYDPHLRSFTNINTRDDLRSLQNGIIV